MRPASVGPVKHLIRRVDLTELRALIERECTTGAANLRPAVMDWLAGQPHRRLLELAGSRVLMVHSTPWEPRGTYVYPRSAQLARFADSAAEADVVLYGHTHIQMAERIGDVLVVNPGSAGEGRDTGNDRRLSCAVLDLVTHTVEHHDFDNPALLQ